MKDQPDMMMTKTHIGSNEPEKRVPKTNQNGEDHSLQDTILQIPLMDDISINKKAGATHEEGNLPSTSYKKQETINKNAMYLSNIKRGTTKTDLSRLLDEYGNIKRIVKEKIEDNVAVIFFYDDNDLRNAISNIDGQDYRGRKLNAQITKRIPNPVLTEDKSKKSSMKSSKPLLTSHIQKFKVIPEKSTPIHWKKKAMNPTEKRRPIRMTLKRMEEDQTSDFQIFNRESLQIIPVHHIIVPPLATVPFAAKILRQRNPDEAIQDCEVSLICGPPPFFQIVDGTYSVKNSLLTPSIRNNSGNTIYIGKNKIIQGTSCHMDNYVLEQIETMHGSTKHEKWAAYHIQAKMYQRMNYINNMAIRMEGQDKDGLEAEDINPWKMDTN